MFKTLKKNSGFTMIELLAAVVVLGVMMMVAVPTVMEVLRDSRNKTYIDDAIRFVSTTQYKMNSDNNVPVPSRGGCLIMNLTYIDNNTFNDAPYDGEYDRTVSMVVAKRNPVGSDEEYVYYVRLLEKLPGDGYAYRGISTFRDVNSLYEKKAKDKFVESVAGREDGNEYAFDLSDYVSSNPAVPAKKTISSLKSMLNSKFGINCGDDIVIYGTNREEVYN